MKNYFEFLNSVKIINGELALEKIDFELKNLKCENPLLLTDNGIVNCGLKDKFCQITKIKFDNIFYDIPQDSGITIIDKIVKFYNEKQCDGIVALGGGSVIDTAKGLKLRLLTGKPLKEIMGYERIEKLKNLPFIVIPTTCGTGSECTQVAVIADNENNKKLEFISSEVLPNIAVLDVRVIENLPTKLIISTSLDALTHAIESYISLQHNPLTDIFSISAMKLIFENLPKICSQENLTEVKQNLLLASNLAGIAFSNSMVGLVHAIGHSLGGVCKIPHGNAMAMLLGEVLEFNQSNCEDRFAELVRFIADENEYCSTKFKSKLFVPLVKNFVNQFKEFGIDLKLQDYGVDKSQFDEIVEKAYNDGAIIVNCKNVTKKDIYEILEKIY